MRISWDELGQVKEAETSFLKLKVGDEVFFYRSSNEVIYKKRFLRAKNGKSVSFLEGSPVNKLSVELL